MRHGVSLALAVAAAGALLAPFGRAGEGHDGTRDVSTVFFVAKSENKNQVHYGIRLDEACAPSGETPVYAYWRMLERGPLATEPLLSREVRAYGVADERVLERGPRVSRTRVTLEALRSRPMLVESYAEGPRCAAHATLPISGVPAALESVFVQLAWPFGVAYLTLSGSAIADGGPVHERVEP